VRWIFALWKLPGISLRYDRHRAFPSLISLLNDEQVLAYEFEGKRYDCGAKLGFLIATVEQGLLHRRLIRILHSAFDLQRKLCQMQVMIYQRMLGMF
jgi:hypothetical protein